MAFLYLLFATPLAAELYFCLSPLTPSLLSTCLWIFHRMLYSYFGMPSVIFTLFISPLYSQLGLCHLIYCTLSHLRHFNHPLVYFTYKADSISIYDLLQCP